MFKIKKMPIKISSFLILFVIFEIYYFFIDYFTFGIFNHYGYTIESLKTTSYLLITLFIMSLIFISLCLITYGFIKRKIWARKFTLLFIIWASLWPIWGIAIGNNILFHLIILIFYVLAFIYVISNHVKDFFIKLEYFTYGDYTLYKRQVDLKSGRSLTIHFFSKKQPKSGTPTIKPEGYIVKVNKKSNLPFLKKQNKNSAKKVEKQKEEIKKENKEKITKKSSNVIYVVSKPQPGQVRGDWAVRSHGKIYSHHRTKENAIKAARKIAKKREATVLVQNTDGTFSKSYKNKTK